MRGKLRFGHPVKWDNATLSLSGNRLWLNRGSVPVTKPCVSSSYTVSTISPFKILRMPIQKILSLGTKQLISPALCEELGRAPQSTGWSWLSSTARWGQSVFVTAAKIHIYIYVYVFTNCTYLHDLIKYWSVEIRTPFTKVFISCPSVIFLCKLELPRLPRKLKTVHIAKATIHC